MSIGESLAAARRQAGLTIADVSAHTRIRKGLIRAIERDDFAAQAPASARRHIRAIATAVGADAETLIRQYDAAHPPGSQERRQGPPGRQAARRRPGRAAGIATATIVTLAVIAFAASRVVAGIAGPQRPAASSSASRPATAPASGPPARARPSAAPSVTTASRTPAARPSATTVPVSNVTPVSATALGPGGTADGDNPQEARLALSGNPATPWRTDWYATAAFGNLKAGTGLLLDLGRTLTVTSAIIQMGNTPAAVLQLRAGTTPADLATVAADSDASGLVRLRLRSPVRARYLLIWFTGLPPDGNGTYQAAVSAVTATVTP